MAVTGRSLFSVIRPAVLMMVRILRFFPYPFRLFLFELFNGVPFKLGVLFRYICGASIFGSTGDNVYIAPHVTIKNPGGLRIGSNVALHQNVYIDALGGVYIGDDVSIAHQSSLVSFNHTWVDNERPIKYNDLSMDSIVIEGDVWVACGVRILAGAHISKRSVVAAGSVVIANQKYPERVLLGGLPARVIKEL